MMKMASILRKKTVAELLERNSHFDSQCFNAVFNKSGFSTVRQNIDKIYASYQVYKGKAALSVEPVLPKFTRVNSGSLKVDRPGVMMLAFSAAIGERKYDWEKKQLFALSPTEVGSLISLGPNDSCEFFHDPSMKTSNAGQVRKSLKIKPTAGGSGYFFSLSVVNNVAQTNECFTIPVTLAEFAVMRTAFSYALPHIMGWSGYTSQQPVRSGDSTWKEDERPLGTVTTPKAYTNNFSELEWEK